MRLDLDLDQPTKPDWQFEGWHYPYDLIMGSCQEYDEHGVLLVAGGYLDQPPEWWQAVRIYHAIYNTLRLDYEPEYQAMLDAKHGK